MKRLKKKAVLVSFRCPEDIYQKAIEKAEADDTDFSKILRRALKRELQNSGFAQEIA